MLNSQNTNVNQVQANAQPLAIPQLQQTQPKARLDVNNSPALDMAGFEKLPITQALLQKGLVTKQQALGIKSQIENTGKLESDVILSGLFIDQDKLIQIKSVVFKIPFIDLANTPIPVETLQKLRSDVAQRYQAIAFDDQPDHIKIAMVDPLDIQATNFISTMIGKRVDAYFADPASITKIIQTKYGAQVGSEVSKAL